MNLLGLPYWVWGILSCGVAVLFVFVYPYKPLTGIRFFLQRWGHSLVWLFLAAACFVAPSSPDLARKLAGLGGLMYLAFMLGTFAFG
ncbi:hypothetical protein [Deinococcus roseus]|uniref:Uncharacterized protein n=1 Tax=Deinococcus roseus TaxID=392414 RepID=A0ABQ2CX85_9DEIO|nr:hypothetical protein [Deinococcus roseus]GGJ29815.1 hypothetical protein GCM10008938_14830 [Deinococcus roseus]